MVQIHKDSIDKFHSKGFMESLRSITNYGPHLRVSICQVLDGGSGIWGKTNVSYHPQDKGIACTLGADVKLNSWLMPYMASPTL